MDKKATSLIHSDYEPPADFGGLNVAVHRASTITFPSVSALRTRDPGGRAGYSYGLHGTPTSYALEERIARLDEGRHTLLVPSGLAAIALVNLSLLRAGDEVLLPDNVYAPSREMGAGLLKRLGVSLRLYDPLRGADIGEHITAATRLVWIESPGSVTMEVADVGAMAAAARTRGVLTALDNTWATGLCFKPFQFGVDIVMQAVTKYLSGGSDVLMGSVTTRDAGLHETLVAGRAQLGYGVSGDDCYRVLRGLTSLEVRLARHESSALAVARWLAARPEVASVRHPALPGAPGHEVWRRDFLGSTGLFSFVLRDGIAQAQVDAMVDALRIFRIGHSWGGAVSLAVPYVLAGRARSVVPWTGGPLVRLYVGLEDADDLIADLEAAFAHLGASA